MNYYYLLLGLSSTFCLVSSITIREAVVVGDGSDEDLPVEEGKYKYYKLKNKNFVKLNYILTYVSRVLSYINILGESLVMKCTSDTEWSSCNWVHEIEDQIVRIHFFFS